VYLDVATKKAGLVQLSLGRVLFAFSFLSVCASATPIVWNVSGAFADGGAMSGSFVYDVTGNAFSSINIATTTGSVRSGATYTLANPCCVGFPSSALLLFVTTTGDLTGTPSFAVALVSAMSNAGGTINFVASGFHQEQSCATANCGAGTIPTRLTTSGFVTAVPEPTTLLLGLPLGVMLFLRRRHLR